MTLRALLKKITAQMLGGLAACVAIASYVGYQRLRPKPCTGGVFLELRPPLSLPGPYHFHFELDGPGRICEFEAMPKAGGATVEKTKCALPLEVSTRLHGDQPSIIGVTLGAAPDALRLRVKRGQELIYDTELELEYAPYAIRREDSARFCGDRAFAKPACVRGSSACAPFRPECDGPEDCPSGKVCCVSPEWGREYGPSTASECSSKRGCLDRFGRIACHAEAECPADMSCDDRSLAGDFSAPVRTCQQRPGAP